VSATVDCAMWRQIGWSVQLSVMLWFGTILSLLVSGLRNRSSARWVAVVKLGAMIPLIQDQQWSFNHCLSRFGQITSLVWWGTLVVMMLHQLLQSRCVA
jgi:hypothetical protein